MSNLDPTIQAIVQLASQLGVAAIFILAWWQERKERQQTQAQLLEMQTAHRAEMLKIIEQMFGTFANLHLPIPSGNTVAPPGMDKVIQN